MNIKNVITVLLFIAIIPFLTSCRTAVPTTNAISIDLVNQTILLNYGEFTITDTTTIETLKILKKDIKKKDRYYCATVDMKLKNEHITINGKSDIEYSYIPNEGWIIQNITMDNETVLIEVNNPIDANTLQAILTDTTLVYQSQDNTYHWPINDLNKITDIKVLDIVKSDNALSNQVEISIISKNPTEEFSANIILNLTYSIYNSSWDIDDIEVVNSTRKLHAGINKDILKELLTGITLYDIMKVDFNNDTIEYDWDIDETNEIVSLDILEQSTNLDAYHDNVNVKITLKKDNIELSNNIIVDCIYDSEGWYINDITVPIATKSYKLLEEYNISHEALSHDLVGKSFSYAGYFFWNTWNIEEDELQSANIIEKAPSNYGNSIKYLATIKLKGSDKTISGIVIITYEYNSINNTCEITDIERVNDFEVIDNN